MPGSLADQQVHAREDRYEKQGADQDRDDVDGNLRVADAPDVDETVGVLVREGASHERVRHPRNRDQQGAPQRRPRNAAARSHERGHADEGDGDDNALQRVSDERKAREDLVGADERRVDDRGHRDHHERAQVRGQGRPDVGRDVAGEEPPRGHAGGARGQHVLLGQDAPLERYWAEHEWIGIDQRARALSLCSLNEAPTREDVLELAPATVSSDFERAQAARIEAIADAVDQAAAGTFWLATQTLFDPEEDMDWRIVALVDVPASDEANRVALATITVGPR